MIYAIKTIDGKEVNKKYQTGIHANRLLLDMKLYIRHFGITKKMKLINI